MALRYLVRSKSVVHICTTHIKSQVVDSNLVHERAHHHKDSSSISGSDERHKFEVKKPRHSENISDQNCYLYRGTRVFFF